MATEEADEGIHRLLVERKRIGSQRRRSIIHYRQEYPKSLHVLCLIRVCITDTLHYSVMSSLFVIQVGLPFSFELLVVKAILYYWCCWLVAESPDITLFYAVFDYPYNIFRDSLVEQLFVGRVKMDERSNSSQSFILQSFDRTAEIEYH